MILPILQAPIYIAAETYEKELCLPTAGIPYGFPNWTTCMPYMYIVFFYGAKQFITKINYNDKKI